MKTVLFLVEKFPYLKKAEQLAALVNRLENHCITVQILKDGEKYRHLFRTSIICKTEPTPCRFTAFLPPEYLYRKIVNEKYDTVIAWTEGKCVRILSGCPYPDTGLFCMIHSDLSETGRFTAGFHSWYDAAQAYQKLHGCLVSDPALCKPFCSVSGIKPSKIRVIPPIRETELSKTDTFHKTYTSPGTLQICSAGEIMSRSTIRRLYKLHTQLLAEGYWHRIIVIAGKKRIRFPRDTFLHFPWNSHTAQRAAACDLFLCPNDEPSTVDTMVDACRAGIPVVAVEGLLTNSILNGGKFGHLTEDNPESIKSALRLLLSDPTLRYTYAKSARISSYISHDETIQSFCEITASKRNKTSAKPKKTLKMIEKTAGI